MFRQLIKIVFLFGITLVFCLVFFDNHLSAQSLPFYWEYINVDIAVQTNGDMLVTETQKYTFTGDYENQRYRYISLDKVDEITDVTVSENGQLLPSKTEIKNNNEFWIFWEHKLKPPASHIFVLKYRVVGGLHIDGNNAQVYWTAIFSDRKAPIKKAKIKVHLPEKLATSIQDFQSFGTPANIRKVNLKTIEAIAQNTIPPGKNLEVQVTFSRQGTDIQTPHWQNSQTLSNHWGLIILFFFVLFYSRLHTKRHSNQKSSQRNSRNSRDVYQSENHYYDPNIYNGGGDGGGGDGGGGGGDGGGDGGGG